MTLWMEVTQDDLELPVIVADSVLSLARKKGVSVSTIKSALSRYRKGKIKKCRYRKVEIEDES